MIPHSTPRHRQFRHPPPPHPPRPHLQPQHHCHNNNRQYSNHNNHRQYHNHLPSPPVFVVKLLFDHRLHHLHYNPLVLPLESVISQCNPKPLNYFANPARDVAARLFFRCKSDAVEAIVSLWERRLAGDHVFTPVPEFGSGVDTLNEKTRAVFQLHLEKVLEGELVRNLEKKIESLLKRPKGFRLYEEFKGKRERLKVEMEGVERRVEEFRKGIKCLSEYLEGKREAEQEDGELGVLRFDKEEGLAWSKLNCLVLREYRRLEDGLPIYGFRSQILQTLHYQQVQMTMIWFD